MVRSMEPEAMFCAVGSNRVAKISPECPLLPVSAENVGRFEKHLHLSVP